MRQHRPFQIEDRHIERLAVVYVRQACRPGVGKQPGSTAHQRDQREHALRWGWPEKSIVVIEDLGLSGTGADRPAFTRMLELVSQERVGIILASDIPRLTRSKSDFASLLRLCRDTRTLLASNGSIAIQEQSC